MTKTVTPVSREWLSNLHGKRVALSIDVFGVVVDERGYAQVDHDVFGVNDSPEVALREPRYDDPDDLVMIDLRECLPGIDERGWLVFYRDGWLMARVMVLVPDERWEGGVYSPPAKVWPVEPDGPTVEVRDYGHEVAMGRGAAAR